MALKKTDFDEQKADLKALSDWNMRLIELWITQIDELRYTLLSSHLTVRSSMDSPSDRNGISL